MSSIKTGFSITGQSIGPKERDNSPEWRALLDKQRERENVSFAEGEKQFRAQVAKAQEAGVFAATQVGQWMLRSALEPLARAVGDWLAQPKVGRPGGGEKVAKEWAKEIGTTETAYIVMKCALDAAVQESNRTARVCRDIATTLQAELKYQRLHQQAPTPYKAARARSKAAPKWKQQQALEKALRHEGIDTRDLEITDEEEVKVGSVFLELLRTATQLVENVAIHEGIKTPYTLELSPQAYEQLSKRTDALALLQPQKQPMIVQPLDWTPGQRGGYRFKLHEWEPLIRRGYETEETEEWDARLERVVPLPAPSSAEEVPMPLVYKALNAIQGTEWRINRHVYELVREIERRGQDFAGVAFSEVKTGDKKGKAKRLKTARILNAAQSDLDASAIWFPHSLDFRGRVYPVADYLSPQGDDLSRALLTFAHGKPVDAEGERWLAIHGANCLGTTPPTEDKPKGQKVSKLSHEERVQWVHSHTQEIIQVAENPLSSTWWWRRTSPDEKREEPLKEPLQFYAFCVEWRNLTRARATGQPYVCSLPVRMDGTCNGIQHFSAMFRDEKGGTAVNFVWQPRPQDIYQDTAEAVLSKLLAASDPLAAKWSELHQRLAIVDRELCKRPTMTFGYGATLGGFWEQVYKELQGRDNWHEIKDHFGTKTNAEGQEVSRIGDACRLMAAFIWETLEQIIPKAFEGRQWFQDCASAIVNAKRSPEWSLPTGFGVRQVYLKTKEKRVKTVLQGGVRFTLDVPTKGPNLTKHKNAIGPNVIHSLDAAALMLAVHNATAAGVQSFAVVHDSYGTLAADCAVLVHHAKQSFAYLYATNDMLQSLHEQFKAQGAILDPPTKGTLDVNGLFASEYVFS